MHCGQHCSPGSRCCRRLEYNGGEELDHEAEQAVHEEIDERQEFRTEVHEQRVRKDGADHEAEEDAVPCPVQLQAGDADGESHDAAVQEHPEYVYGGELDDSGCQAAPGADASGNQSEQGCDDDAFHRSFLLRAG